MVVNEVYANGLQVQYKVEQYNDNNFRLIRIFKKQKSLFDTEDFIDSSEGLSDTNIDIISNQHDISLSRTKRNIRRICFSNNFEFFATWTIDSNLCDRYSLTAVVDKMKELLKAYQRKYKDFKYIYVIEKHKDGAFHFHGLVKNIPLEEFCQFKVGDKMSRRLADKVLKGSIIYHIPFFDNKLGFNSFTKINHYSKCCNYILKYITKDTIETTENQRYFCSRGLSKGQSYSVSYIPNELFENIRSYDFHINNDKNSPLICSVRDININELNKSDLLNFGNTIDLPSFRDYLQKILKIKKDF